MKKLFITLIILVLSIGSFCQQYAVYGYVFDKKDKSPVYGAKVEFQYSKTNTFTDSLGRFKLKIKDGFIKIEASHKDFASKVVTYNRRSIAKPLRIGLDMNKYSEKNIIFSESTWKERKNVICFMPFELTIGSIGLQYERFLNGDHSIGLHTSIYIYGLGYSAENEPRASNRFTGWKISPFFRYYSRRYERKGFFVEIDFNAAKININPLLYRREIGGLIFNEGYYWVKDTVSFKSYGGGLAFGYLLYLPKKENGVFNISVGLQYLPMNVPEKLPEKIYDDYKVDKTWWYFGGPGSIIQIRLAYGGIF